MGNEHIGRISAIGLGKEVTAGTSEAPSVWIPKMGGVIVPEFESAIDDSGYGTIDEVYDTQTTKNFSKLTLTGIMRDDFIGHLLLGALGTYNQVACVELSSITSGTPARLDVVMVYETQLLDNAAAVDKGGAPNMVEIPATGHPFTDGDSIVIVGSTNYNGTFVVANAATNTFEIETAYNAETFAGTEIATGPDTTWTGILKKIFKTGTVDTDYYFVSTTTGTLVDADTMTDDTWTALVDLATNSAVKGHFFERANTNTHQTYTMYDDDPVASVKSTYSMINSFEMSAEVGDFVKFSAEFRGKKMEAGGSLTPAYTSDNPFLASMANVYFATNEGALNAATASCMQNFRVAVNKNLADIQCFGTDDINSLHNQQFNTEGDLEALYNSATLRDLVIDSTKQAVRFEILNDSTTAIVAAQLYPSIIVDLAKAGFKERTKTDANNDIVKQTMGYSGEYDADNLFQIEILLLNVNSTGY